MRTEKDALGEVHVNDDAFYGAQTARAMANFDIGDETFPAEMIRADAMIKKAAASVNASAGILDPDIAEAIIAAADAIIDGGYADQFPLRI